MTKVKEMMKKMCVLGDGAVGKTSLIRKFVLDRFDDRYIATIGTKTSAKALQFPTVKEVINLKLQIWDILGQKGYTKLHLSSFRGTKGIFMVADLTRKETLHSIETYWIPKMQYLVGSIPFIILGNKKDLIKNAEFTEDDLKKLSSKYKVQYYLTSAKSGKNVNRAFYSLGKRMLELDGVEPIRPAKPRVIHPRLLFEGEKSEITSLIDKIIEDFCMEYRSLEDAMPVLRKQFELAELDLNNPTLEALKRGIERLARVEMSFKKRKIVDAKLAERLRWIEEIKIGKSKLG
ncbi:MAG: Rab family GTPase [Thermoplasmata archaeon]